MSASGKSSPKPAAKNPTEHQEQVSDKVTAQRGPNHGSEGLCDRNSGRGAAAGAAAATATGGADTHHGAAAAATAVKKQMPRRRNVATKDLDTGVAAGSEASPAETGARCVLRPILIRSLARQKELKDGGVPPQVVMSPPSAMKPATDKLPRRVVVAQGSPAREALATTAEASRTAGTVGSDVYQRKMLVSDVLSPAAEIPRDGSSPPATTIDKFSEALEISANNSKDRASLGGHRCRWAGRLLEGYSEALETRPLTFKCATSAIVGALGDVAAQAVSWAVGGRGDDVVWHDTRAVRQTLAVAIDGFCVNAPFLHYAYAALERWLPTEESTENAVAQVLVDVFVLNPFYAFTFIVTTGILEGKSVRDEIVPTIRRDYSTLVLWLVVIGLALAPPHMFLFRRLPLKWRVLVSDAIDLVWTFVACFVIEPR